MQNVTKNVTKTVWDCRQAHVEIALKAGGDSIDPVAASLLESHLSECAACRQYLTGMESALELLQSSAVEVIPGKRLPSLWPRVAQRLPQPAARTAYARFNLWVPTAAMAAACAAMILVTIVQIERVAPFEPLVTPHLRTVLHGEPPRNIFVDDRQFATYRRPGSGAPSVLGTTPVSYPAETGAFRMDFSPDADRAARWKNREW